MRPNLKKAACALAVLAIPTVTSGEELKREDRLPVAAPVAAPAVSCPCAPQTRFTDLLVDDLYGGLKPFPKNCPDK